MKHPPPNSPRSRLLEGELSATVSDLAKNAPRASLADLFFSFLRLGAVSFGGPAIVAYIKRLAVTRKGWLSEEDFQQGLALCQAVPGSTAMQCAAYVGLRTRRLRGAVAAFVGFGLPAFVLMLALSVAYHRAAALSRVNSVLVGLRVLVVVLVANAAWSFGRPALRNVKSVVLAVLSAVVFLLGVNPIAILLGASLVGALALRGSEQAQTVRAAVHPLRALRRAAPVVLFTFALVFLLFALDRRLASLGLAMIKVDLFAFGGGFASLPIMYREAVESHHWLTPHAFMDGIALGQVTPGPIIITATFIGYQVAGSVGAMVATVCVFVPSLAILLVAEPWFQGLSNRPAFRGATKALVLSFVGLLLSVTVRMALAAPWSIPSGAIAVGALVVLALRVDVLWVVLVGAGISAVLL